ncbi:MAG: hopanoid biosynthesis-associated protein HpnK [Methylocella sp.]
MNHLIVTADDFGFATEINEAVERAYRTGILSAASLMVAGPAAADAVGRARRMPGLHVGLHLVLAEGRPALPPELVPDLVDGNGYLRADMVRMALEITMRPAMSLQVSAEIVAQFEAFRATGLPLDHVNAHKHFHLHPIIAAKVISIGKRYGMRALRVPFEPAAVLRRVETRWPEFHELLVPISAKWLRAQARRAHLITPDAVFGLKWSGAMTTKRLANIIANLPRGTVEVYTHPATSAGFAGHVAGYGYAEELAALTSEASIEAVRRSRHRRGGYSDIVRDSAATFPGLDSYAG